ncbi:zinc-binding alcohol dehydrogenase family protein [Paractinoplanes rhizophilus]|uniref:Zinc-binding alcohol dehydrogenase family protein n=1 Tax=Paractinoplanes rhizophilus TaxID=1416877 RepID=A0ABW2HJP8_9ACTN
MQALVFDRPASDTSATRVAELATPAPGPGQLAVRVAYAGINFKDVMARRGDPGYVTRWPFVPGLEITGTVVGTGRGVTAHRVGDQVVALTNNGGLAEIALADAALTVGLPAGLDAAAAVTVPGALTTAVLLHDHVARVRAGDVVVVHSAAGAVGRALADVARVRSGARLIGAVGAPARVAAAHDAGYPDVLVRGDTLADEARAATGGRGADIVLDPQGTTYLDQDFAMLAPAGRVILFGNASGAALAALPPTGSLYRRNASVGGFSLEALSAAEPATVAAAMSTALGLLADGRATADPTILSGLAAAPEAQQALADGAGKGKYVIEVG